MNMTYYTIQIPVNDNNLRKAEEVRAKLVDQGIRFDTGSDGKMWDWELDWSLSGCSPQDVSKLLDEHDVEYVTTVRVNE